MDQIKDVHYIDIKKLVEKAGDKAYLLFFNTKEEYNRELQKHGLDKLIELYTPIIQVNSLIDDPIEKEFLY